jgi:hypothetical protein
VALYGFGRFFTEGIRLDFSYDTFGPIRFNQAVAALICLAGVAVLVWLIKRKPGREESVYLPGQQPSTAEPHEADDVDSQPEPDEQSAQVEQPEAEEQSNQGDSREATSTDR